MMRFLLLLAFVAVAGDLAAKEVPSEYTNLQVLPRDISRREIVSIMRGWVGAVGGGTCSYCHMVSDGLDQPTDNFASDEKATKRKARIMLEMVNRINTTTLPSLPDRRTPHVEVTCRTCHGGINRPEAIEDVVWAALEDEGIEAATARYRELRERHLGSRAYDFSATPMNTLARRLGKDRAAEAARFLELNVELLPPYLPTLLLLGNMHEANDDRDSALSVYRSILASDSSLRFYDSYARRAQRRIDALER